jgi:hypothetical protein
VTGIVEAVRARLPRWLGGQPGATQRDALALRGVGRDAITLAGGELRAVFRVPGVPLHAMPDEEVEGFLHRWAACLNALPAGVHFVSRTHPGGLEGYAQEKRTAATALAARGEAALARLADDQAAHAEGLTAAGAVRASEQYLVVRGRNPAELATRCRQVQRLMDRVGLSASRIRDRELAAALARQWRPGWRHHFSVYAPDWTLVYDEGNRPPARVAPARYATGTAISTAAGGRLEGTGR